MVVREIQETGKCKGGEKRKRRKRGRCRGSKRRDRGRRGCREEFKCGGGEGGCITG